VTTAPSSGFDTRWRIVVQGNKTCTRGPVSRQRSDFAAAPKGSEGDDGVVWRSTLVSWVQGLLVLCFLFGSTAAAFFSRYFSFLHSPCVLTDEREHNG